MTRDEVREVLVEVLTEIQDLRGEEMTEIGDEMCPMEDLAGFDSLGALEATIQLSERLSRDLDPKLFWKDGTPLNVAEIVDCVCRTIGVEEGGNRG